MKVISYCLYGDSDKYYEGLLRNMETIIEKLPDYVAMLFIPSGYCFKEKYRHKINLHISTGRLIVRVADIMAKKGDYLMFQRFIPISLVNVSIMHSRDLDSPILDREIECIRWFEKSDKKFMIIRDHPFHTSRILGGLWSCKSGILQNMNELVSNFMGRYPEAWYSDQHFLEEHIYPKVFDKAIIHDPFNLYPDEKESITPFYSERVDDEFCGMVLEADGSRIEQHHTALLEIIKKNS